MCNFRLSFWSTFRRKARNSHAKPSAPGNSLLRSGLIFASLANYRDFLSNDGYREFERKAGFDLQKRSLVADAIHAGLVSALWRRVLSLVSDSYRFSQGSQPTKRPEARKKPGPWGPGLTKLTTIIVGFGV